MYLLIRLQKTRLALKEMYLHPTMYLLIHTLQASVTAFHI